MKGASTTPEPQGEHDPLIFVWPERNASFVLPIFFLLAVLCHAAAFYLFQIVYPPSTAVTPPTAQLLYITGDSPENQAILQWADSQLPATVARIRDTPLPSELRPIQYKPSYQTPGTLPKTANLSQAPVTYPLAYGDLPFASTRISAESPRKEGRSVQSALTFSTALQPFENRQASPLFPVSKTGRHPEAVGQGHADERLRTVKSLQPTSFLIGLNRRGELHFAFLHESSGDKSLDRKASSILNEYPFLHPTPEPETEISWGYVTFTWGAEAYDYEEMVPEASEEEPALPASEEAPTP